MKPQPFHHSNSLSQFSNKEGDDTETVDCEKFGRTYYNNFLQDSNCSKLVK
jgi:hypothetical protein